MLSVGKVNKCQGYLKGSFFLSCFVLCAMVSSTETVESVSQRLVIKYIS